MAHKLGTPRARAFDMGDLTLKLRNTAVVDSVYRHARNAISGPGWGAFHQDRVYRAMMFDLLDAMPFTSFVETGTYRGFSTEFIAHRHRNLPVFTIEIVERTFKRSRRALGRYANITTLLGTSNEVVRQLIRENKVGAMPLYYLDAHWQTYWPLQDEIRAIGEAGGKAVMVVDDFEVPGQSQFGYDIDGRGDLTAGEKCNLDYIRPALNAKNQYDMLFPHYTRNDAFTRTLRGHVVLFQNMPEEHESFAKRALARRHYWSQGSVVV